MRPLDTSEEAFERQLEIYRRMPGEERVRIAVELTETSRELLRAGIRHRHPEYDEDEVRWAFLRLWLNDDALFGRVYPSAPLLEP